MTVVLAFLIVVAGIAGVWLARHGIMEKPWLHVSPASPTPGHGRARPAGSPGRIGLRVFLTVVGALFAVLLSANLMRMEATDWRVLPNLPLVWVATAFLALSSATLHGAVLSARRRDPDGFAHAIAAATVTAAAFLVTQVLTWRQLASAGVGLSGNPAASFFYLLTGLHGLHIVGGLAALGRCWARWARTRRPEAVREGIELCAVYWHVLLAIWLILAAVLTGWAGAFAATCLSLVR
ncbi:cytochrome c oxidase subunit 3 [Chthonobacter rhizosphaerae]|uniref:cytochrome c oxidase subunit 3 n=1 Tax=Chthonobacter rhizosphaerae TaxID=2735553 RepID=UPI0015EF79C0|nr:cytochrome c oxidase subunit 3 [Chthonobacter rhizosphaerae]